MCQVRLSNLGVKIGLSIDFIAIVTVCTFILAPAAAAAPTLTLAEVIRRALDFAPSISAAAAASDFSRARVGEMRAPLYPSLNGNIEYQQTPGYDPVVTNRGLTDTTVNLTYTAIDFGRRLALAHAAAYQSAAALYGVRAAQAQIVFAATNAYFDLMRTQQQIVQYQKSLDRMVRYVAVIEQLENNGKAVANDVLKLQSARDNAELSLAATRRAARQAAIALGALIGNFDSGNLTIEETSALPPLPAGNLSTNPTLRADQRAIDSAELAIKAAKAERYPNFNVNLSTGFLGVDPPRTFNRYFGASYDGAINVPIFQGGLIKAHVDEASAQLLAAQAQYKQDNVILAQRIEDATTRYRNAVDQLAILTRSQPTADDAFALYWTRFLGGGRVTLLEVLDAYQQAESFRVSKIDQQFAVRQAAAEMELIYGVSR
jgi:outer membrane protein TolC